MSRHKRAQGIDQLQIRTMGHGIESRMGQLRGLLGDGGHDAWMTMAQIQNADAANKINVFALLAVVHLGIHAAYQFQWVHNRQCRANVGALFHIFAILHDVWCHHHRRCDCCYVSAIKPNSLWFGQTKKPHHFIHFFLKFSNPRLTKP